MLGLVFTALVFLVIGAILTALYLEHKLEHEEDIPVEEHYSRYENVVAILKDLLVTLFRLAKNAIFNRKATH